MSLTTGRGPLSLNPAGNFIRTVPDHELYVEPFRRRVQGITGSRTVVDSERVLLIHRPGAPPTYAFPAADAEGVPQTESQPEVPGYVHVPWEAVEAWYEEDEQVFGHPRNPYHRVDCVRTSRRLRVEVAGVVLVDTIDTVGVYETALEPCLYVRPELVRRDLLVAGTTATYCPYKGTAWYWTAVVDDAVVEDVAWSYEDPRPECLPLRRLLCFDEARATVVHDLPSAAEPVASRAPV